MELRKLGEELDLLDSDLGEVLEAVARSVEEVSETLKGSGVGHTGSLNAFGDQQLEADMIADEIIFRNLSRSGFVESVRSEEVPEARNAGGSGFSVAYDPLDGSSIFSANFAVGTIIGVWPGGDMIGQSGADQCAAVYALYGRHTIMVIARHSSTENEWIAQEWAFTSGSWHLTKDNLQIGSAKYFAPGNAICASENESYRKLILGWMDDKFTLRYSGGMVPDVHHLLVKGGGVFCSPSSHSCPAKLRLLYECAPMAFIIEACGGAALGPNGRILDEILASPDARTPIILGTQSHVEECIPALEAPP